MNFKSLTIERQNKTSPKTMLLSNKASLEQKIAYPQIELE